MNFRRYDLDIPMPIDERLKKALATVIKRGLLPEKTTERDFLMNTIVVNGLAMVEADLIKKERSERSVLLPEEMPRVPQGTAPHLDRPAMERPPFSVGPGGQRTYHRKSG